MHPQSICSGCRFPIYKFQKKFEAQRDARYKDLGITPAFARANTLKETNCNDIFDSLGVKLWCCRMHMVSGTYYADSCYGPKTF
jgi:DNA-directed RNA polymerase subunit N (RpoN/RPB10)